MKYVTVIIAFFMALQSFAQKDSGQVAVYKDPRIQLLIKKQAQINEETTRNSRRTMPGFRIQLINSTDRNSALAAKTRVYQLYPEVKAYLQYQSPYYRLKVGNFKTRQEAEDFLRGLTSEFSNNIFILRDTIEVKPEIDTTNDL